MLTAGSTTLALGDPIKDDGETITGKFSAFRDGSTKKRISSDDAYYYRGKWVTHKQLQALIRQCQARGGTDCEALDLRQVADPATLQLIAVRLATQLRLPAPRPTFGPEPEVNEWKMLSVGYPIWLWTEGSRTMTDAASADGYTFTMTARLRSTTFSMGDGRSITCPSMSRYSGAVRAGEPSPDCGHVYEKPSLPKGRYPVVATAHWDVAWSVGGLTGTVAITRTASRQLPIGELSALNR